MKLRFKPSPDGHGGGVGPAMALSALQTLWQASAVRVVSVDLYDTVLWRACRPELLRFRDIAEAQQAGLRAAGLPAPGATALHRARLVVHKRCCDRVRHGPGEVRHADIIGATIRHLNLPEAAAPVLAEAEIGYEIAAVRPNRRLAAALADLCREKPVVLTSDMYLPAAAIRRVLAAAVPVLADLPLFLSAEIGLTKRHGALFGHAAAAMGVRPGEILHLGDHPVSDVLRPREAGLAAAWTPRSRLWRAGLGLGDTWVRWRLRRAGALYAG